MKQCLVGKVAIVTGASRGIGKGIALQLAEAGATVYITGRTLLPDGRGTSLTECVEEIKKRGGHAVPVQCDHEKDDEVKGLFDRVAREQNGRLDILVNNAYSSAKFKNRFVLNSESAEYSGRGVVHLATDPDIMAKSGRILTSGDLADEYGFKDIDGRSPPDYVRRLRDRLSMTGYTRLAAWVPAFVKIPGWMLSAYYHII
ncbi:dehydrogenase/reductase SDR family member 1-like [Branchiostoma floridae x Branchiostoma belcheri]